MRTLVVKISFPDDADADSMALVANELSAFEIDSIQWETPASPVERTDDPVQDARQTVRNAITRSGRWRDS